MKALVLAGGFPQIELIKELKNRDYTVILADYYEEPVAKKYADVFYQVSTLDVDAITKVAKAEGVDFLTTVCTDQALLTVAKVSETLGLPCYIDYQTALNVTNKAYMKNVFENNKISTAKHIVMECLNLDKINSMKYPLIVKPVDCNSSKGVKKVLNQEELKVAFEDAVRLSRTNTAIIEEFIEGTELSVDVYVEDGKVHVLSVSKLDKIEDNNKFVIFRAWSNPIESEVVIKKIENTAQQIADAFCLKNTPMLIQLISDGNDVFVLEFSARTGGGTKHILIKETTGFDVIKAVVDLTVGNKPHVDKKKSVFKYLIDTFIYCNEGIYDHLEGFEELKNEGIMSDYYIFKWKGAKFDNNVENSGDRIAGFAIQGNSIEELEEKFNYIKNRIKVIDTNGVDIMRHDLLTPLK